MSSLRVKFQPSSTPPSDIFWWGVLFDVLVAGIKQSQLIVFRLSLEMTITKTTRKIVFLSNFVAME